MIKEKIYLPDNAIQNGLFYIIREIFCELKQNKWLIYQLFKRDILSVYKQSMLGFMWAFLFPVISVGTFIVLNSSGIFIINSTGIPYPLFAITGMAFWQFFSSGINASSNSLVKAGRMITKINFSKKSLVIASTGQSAIAFLVQFVFTIILLFYYGITPSWYIFLIPLFLVPVILITIGLGLLLSILNGIARDTGNLISVFLTFFLFLTPVLYKKPAAGFLQSFSEYNPVYYLINVPRDLILFGTTSEITGYCLSSIFSIFVFFLFLFFFHLAETRVTERI